MLNLVTFEMGCAGCRPGPKAQIGSSESHFTFTCSLALSLVLDFKEFKEEKERFALLRK